MVDRRMSKQKKPRNKEYRAKVVRVPKIIPMITAIEAYPILPTLFHTALDAAIKAPDLGTIFRLEEELCIIAGAMSYSIKGEPILGRTDAHSIAIISATNTIKAITQRKGRTGKAIVTPLEAKTLLATANSLDAVLSTVSAYAYETAKHEIQSRLDQAQERAAA